MICSTRSFLFLSLRVLCICCLYWLVLLMSSRDGPSQSPTIATRGIPRRSSDPSCKRMFHTVSDRVSPRHLGFGSTSAPSPFGGGNTGGSLFGNTSSSFGSGGGTCSMATILMCIAIFVTPLDGSQYFRPMSSVVDHYGSHAHGPLSSDWNPRQKRFFPANNKLQPAHWNPDTGIPPCLSFNYYYCRFFVLVC